LAIWPRLSGVWHWRAYQRPRDVRHAQGWLLSLLGVRIRFHRSAPNTVMERSKVPLHKWVYAMYLLVTARKGISSLQLAKEIGVTQKTAWFILGRLREALAARRSRNRRNLRRGKRKTSTAHKKLNAGRGSVGKTLYSGCGTIADTVLAYRPKPKSKAAKKRARKAAKKGERLNR